MPFKKSNKFYDENILVKEKIESLSEASICLLGLFYMEYRIKYYKKNAPNVKSQCEQALEMFYQEVQSNANFEGAFCTFSEFAFLLQRAQARTGWCSLECVIDSMQLESGKSGNIGYRRKAEIVEVIRMVVEQYYELAVTPILKSL